MRGFSQSGAVGQRGGQGRAPRRRRPPASMRRCSSGAAHAGSGAPQRRREVPPAALLLHNEIPTGHPELRVELMLAGNVVKCSVSDNGSVLEPIRRGRGLAIIGELASSLGGRVHTSCAAEGYSFLVTFPLTEVEQRAACATHVVKLKRRKMRRPLRLETSGTEDLGAG